MARIISAAAGRFHGRLHGSTFFFGDDATVDLRGAMRVNLASDPVPLLAQLGWAVAPPQAEHRPPPCRVLTHCQQTECGPASAAAFHAPAPAMPPPLNTSKLRVFLLEGHTGPMNDMLHTMTTTLGVPLNQIGFMLLSQAMEFRRRRRQPLGGVGVLCEAAGAPAVTQEALNPSGATQRPFVR